MANLLKPDTVITEQILRDILSHLTDTPLLSRAMIAHEFRQLHLQFKTGAHVQNRYVQAIMRYITAYEESAYPPIYIVKYINNYKLRDEQSRNLLILWLDTYFICEFHATFGHVLPKNTMI